MDCATMIVAKPRGERNVNINVATATMEIRATLAMGTARHVQRAISRLQSVMMNVLMEFMDYTATRRVVQNVKELVENHLVSVQIVSQGLLAIIATKNVSMGHLGLDVDGSVIALLGSHVTSSQACVITDVTRDGLEKVVTENVQVARMDACATTAAVTNVNEDVTKLMVHAMAVRTAGRDICAMRRILPLLRLRGWLEGQ
ncbi:hypothetical protein MAR_022606 [Mya arenaria]|uniref:Uncharacterized protein n=1 Tax=Mya arenaria TaxID=6604 RepID=A0ABY7DQ63_MYAAR|nr:hypothetical protein MAR_022606 [Mya arenaria]